MGRSDVCMGTFTIYLLRSHCWAPHESSMENFPFKLSQDDSVLFAFDQVITIDSHLVLAFSSLWFLW